MTNEAALGNVPRRPVKGAIVSDFNAWNAKVIDEFRSSGGHLAGDFAGAPLLLLHTHGAKTNAERVNPVMYLEDGGRLFVFASKAGSDANPDWFHNLVANPEVTVELDNDTFAASAVVLQGSERDRVYGTQAEKMPQFAEYQEKTTRVIPVVELHRISAE
jgi:deazaflavin-dependent oxidoreductase (nitroreductase family)